MHNVLAQGPGSDAATATATGGIVDALQHLGWVDITALGVLGVFFVMGLFKGIVWQVSRVVILIAAYATAARVGPGFGEVLLGWTHVGPQLPSEDQQQTAFYIACVLLFVGVLVALSLLALALHKLIQKAGLGFYDRLFGGVVGVGSGAIVVLFGLTVVFMFFPQSQLAAAANDSHSLRLSQQAVDLLGDVVPQELRRVFPGHGDDASAAPADGRALGLPAEHTGLDGAPADATAPQPTSPTAAPAADRKSGG
ncbi:MAG: CvpA family protein [Planctomycetota bacterium]